VLSKNSDHNTHKIVVTIFSENILGRVIILKQREDDGVFGSPRSARDDGFGVIAKPQSGCGNPSIFISEGYMQTKTSFVNIAFPAMLYSLKAV
jgi:hypothetical protein